MIPTSFCHFIDAHPNLVGNEPNDSEDNKASKHARQTVTNSDKQRVPEARDETTVSQHLHGIHCLQLKFIPHKIRVTLRA